MAGTESGNSNVAISVLILAAGKGTRMKSTLPKVLHPVLGRSMLEWVIDIAQKAGAIDITLVLSPETKPFESLLETQRSLRIAVQNSQRGTGDAVASASLAYSSAKSPNWAKSELKIGKPSTAEWVLICAGDTPAMSALTIKDFIQSTLKSKKRLGVLGMKVPEPRGYGRLIKMQDGGLAKIVEERDADSEIRKIKLCNSGVIFAKIDWLFELLDGISPSNSQNEFYLTDVFGAAINAGESAYVFETDKSEEFAGVNDRIQLQIIEKNMLKTRVDELMSLGVTIHLPETVFIEAESEIEMDTRIYPGAYFKGKTKVSRNCVIGPQVILDNSVIGAGSNIGAHSVLIRTTVSAGAIIKPGSIYTDATL